MTQQEFCNLFSQLLGYGWQKKLATLCRLTPAAINNYATGKRKISGDKIVLFRYVALEKNLEQNAIELDYLKKEFTEIVGSDRAKTLGVFC
jgi:DNA-binding transcriptional regulator YdaS (Cro superfamily)